MPITALFLLQALAPLPDAAPAIPAALSVTPRCAVEAGGDVVVCGARDRPYRLPLPIERGAAAEDVVRGTGIGALTPAGRCGIFAGEHVCRKAEMRRYGYSGDRNPVAVAGKLVGRIADPD